MPPVASHGTGARLEGKKKLFLLVSLIRRPNQRKKETSSYANPPPLPWDVLRPSLHP